MIAREQTSARRVHPFIQAQQPQGGLRGLGDGQEPAGLGDTRPRWMAEAECRDADLGLMFPNQDTRPPPRGDSPHLARAKAVCRRGPVRADCLDWAIDQGERFGVWGGMSTRERQAERVRRQTARGAS